MKIALIAFGLAACAAMPAVVAHAQTAELDHALALAAENDIVNPRSFWRSDDGQWSGVAGYGADGEWYEIVIDADGELVRSGHDDGATYPVTIAEAAATAAENGVQHVDTLRLGGGKWFAMGMDAAGGKLWLVIDATSGAVVAKGG